MKKPLALTCLALALILSLASCDTGSTQNTDTTPQSGNRETTASTDPSGNGETQQGNGERQTDNQQSDEQQTGNQQPDEETDAPPAVNHGPSQGLHFTINEYGEDGPYGILDGIGSCTDTYIVIPDTTPEGVPVVLIAQNAFNDATHITGVVIPDSVKVIDGWAFADCTNLTSVSIGNGVTKISGYAFEDCSSLKSISIPESVIAIGNEAFANCSSLTSIHIPKNLTTIFASSFPATLTSITVDEENPIYRVSGNCIIDKWGKLVRGVSDCVIPTDGSITEIDTGAFEGNSHLTDVVIPDGVISLGGSSFANCANLASVTVPASVTHINKAFWRCANLTSITYLGTKAQWEEIDKSDEWIEDCGDYTIHCTDGDITQ